MGQHSKNSSCDLRPISITALRVDDSNDIQFDIRFTSPSCSCSLEFYGDEDTFKDFASALKNFPRSLKDKVTFQIGEDNRNYAYYLSVNVLCSDPTGKTAIKVLADNFGDTTTGYRCEFAIMTSPAQINELGYNLFLWKPEKDGDVFVWPEE